MCSPVSWIGVSTDTLSPTRLSPHPLICGITIGEDGLGWDPAWPGVDWHGIQHGVMGLGAMGMGAMGLGAMGMGAMGLGVMDLGFMDP